MYSRSINLFWGALAFFGMLYLDRLIKWVSVFVPNGVFSYKNTVVKCCCHRLFYLKHVVYQLVIVSTLPVCFEVFSLPAFGKGAEVTKLGELQSAIDAATSEAQRLEDSIMVRQKNVDKSREEMKGYLIQVHEKSSDIIALMNYLHRMKNFSSLLTALTLKRVEDIVHISMALKSISPHTSDRFKGHLDLLQNLAKVRLQLKKDRLEVESLEKDKKKTFINLKKQFSDLDELLYATDQSLPLRHFDSGSQIQELVDRLTIHAMNCQKITKLPEGVGSEIVLTTPIISEEILHYHDLKDRIVRSPIEAEVLLAGNNVEMGGVVLIQKDEYLMLIKGIDKILRYPGTTVKQQQSLGMIFGSTERPKELIVTMWRCKQRSHG